MLFIDIVEFKFINSSFGYEKGDRVLKKVSSALEKLLEVKGGFARIRQTISSCSSAMKSSNR